MEVIDEILERLEWLKGVKGSYDLVNISRKLDEIGILLVTLGTHVTDAYEAVSEAEDDYDIAFAKRFSELCKEKSAASAKPQVEAELDEKKRTLTKHKINYKKLNTFLERCDKVIETHRQSLSILKKEK